VHCRIFEEEKSNLSAHVSLNLISHPKALEQYPKAANLYLTPDSNIISSSREKEQHYDRQFNIVCLKQTSSMFLILKNIEPVYFGTFFRTIALSN
jgi:hypothetical protein